jgi:hypothetical protein
MQCLFGIDFIVRRICHFEFCSTENPNSGAWLFIFVLKMVVVKKIMGVVYKTCVLTTQIHFLSAVSLQIFKTQQV